jgi:ABC-type sugar transport system substrate-binding protein
VETIDSEKYAQANIDELAKDMGGKGGYVIYVGSLTVRCIITGPTLRLSIRRKIS